MKNDHQACVINDITRLNPICVAKAARPNTIEELIDIVKTHPGAISIGGGRFSMGGQIATENSLHIDMCGLNQVIEFSPRKKQIHVQAGIRWREIQELIDSHHLAIKIMQTYANFTVGGALSVNAHGRYVGLGPIILSVNSITMVLSQGELIEASPSVNAEIFYGAIGGYGGLGIIVEVKLDLCDNHKVERQQLKLLIKNYPKHFFNKVKNNKDAVFHNADIYPPHYRQLRAVTWVKSAKKLTTQARLKPNNRIYFFEKYFIWAISETPWGKLRREFLIEPLFYFKKKIVWRNYEASHDVAELEPNSRERSTYVLQEYFIPVAQFEKFVFSLKDILKRYKVNVLNISVRHAFKDPGSIMAWAREEVFAFVIYYKQKNNTLASHQVGIWTRELIDAAISCQGTYYLPYQLHATPQQFSKSYPHADRFFNLKSQIDPHHKFKNKLWDKYLNTKRLNKNVLPNSQNDFQVIFSDTELSDKFYLFLQNIYRIFPEDKFHALICKACDLYKTDKEIYQFIQKELHTIKPTMSELTYALPALLKQKQEMSSQTLELLNELKVINGYVEIGTTGRYISHLRARININNIYLINDQKPSNSVSDLIERQGVKKIGEFIHLRNYDPIRQSDIPDNSIDLVTCYIGLHHSPLNKLEEFIRAITRILRPNGRFIVRDHDVNNPIMHCFVSLAHTVFNAGLGISWENNAEELRHFTAISALINRIESCGLKYTGKKLLQKNDPSLNTLIEFVKEV